MFGWLVAAILVGAGGLTGTSGDDVLHLHQDIDGLVTRGCETIRVEIAG